MPKFFQPMRMQSFPGWAFDFKQLWDGSRFVARAIQIEISMPKNPML